MQRREVRSCLEVNPLQQHRPSSTNGEPVKLASPDHDHFEGLMACCTSSPELYINSEPLAKLPAIAFLVNDADRLDPRLALRATKLPFVHR
jgi:hypothetical protein